MSHPKTPVALTNHGRDRTSERLGVPKASALRLAERAWNMGFGIEELRGSLRSHLERVALKYGDEKVLRLWGQKVWIFCDARLITVFPLPREYWRVEEKLKKRR